MINIQQNQNTGFEQTVSQLIRRFSIEQAKIWAQTKHNLAQQLVKPSQKQSSQSYQQNVIISQ